MLKKMVLHRGELRSTLRCAHFRDSSGFRSSNSNFRDWYNSATLRNFFVHALGGAMEITDFKGYLRLPELIGSIY
jgi:hypothetical protein